MLKQSIIKLCGEITALSIFITNISEHDIFVRYSSHVKQFEIEVVEGGWKKDKDVSGSIKQIDLKIEDAMKELLETKEELENIVNSIYAIEIDMKSEV